VDRDVDSAELHRVPFKGYFTRPLGWRNILWACVGAGGMAVYLVLHST